MKYLPESNKTQFQWQFCLWWLIAKNNIYSHWDWVKIGGNGNIMLQQSNKIKSLNVANSVDRW